MKKPRIVVIIALAAVTAMLVAPALALAAKKKFKAELDGFQETPLTLSTTASGELRLQVNQDETMIDYELSYSDIQFGTATVAHIHLGRPGITGGVSAFLCGGGGKPACPATSGTVTGTITAADVIGPAGQGIAAGELAELLRALREGATYANVHSTGFPGGEIRGVIE
jgi:hypothetical protein